MKYNKGFAPILIALIIAGALALGGGIYYLNDTNKKEASKEDIIKDKTIESKNLQINEKQPTIDTTKNITDESIIPKIDKKQDNIIIINPYNASLVNLSEIGCTGSDFTVISGSGDFAIDKDGNYSAEFITDKQNKICASAISLPKDDGKVYFDAKSTTKTMIFQTIGILTIDPIEAERKLSMIENLNSFSAFYSYTKNNLHKQDLGSMNADSTFEKLLTQCIKEASDKLGINKSIN
jgi:hypothetical protein